MVHPDNKVLKDNQVSWDYQDLRGHKALLELQAP
jgi:hypothetical protein